MSKSRVAERSAAYALRTAVEPAFGASFDLLATAPQGVAKLRQLILSFAIRGKLVPQNAADGSASSLLKRVHEERVKLAVRGTLKRKTAELVDHDEEWAELPESWTWTCLANIGVINPRNDVSDDTEASFVQMSSVPVALLDPHKSERRPWREIKSGFTHFAEGDVGVAKITPCFENGKSTVFRNLDSGIGAGTTELHVVRPLGSIRPDYVLSFLKSPEFLLPGEKWMTGSAGQKRLSRHYFETRAFPLPPLAEQGRIVARVEELMQLCDALEAHGRLQDEQHARLVATLFDALAASASAEELAENWQRVATHFDLLLDRPEAVDALEQTLLQLAVRGLLVPQDPTDEPVGELLASIRAEKNRLVATGQTKPEKPRHVISEEELPYELPPGWRWIRLDELLIKIGAGSTPLGGREVYTFAGVKFLRSQNIWNDGLVLSGVAHISEAVHKRMSATKVVAGDLLFNITGASIGRCALVPDNFDEANVSQHVTIIRTALGSVRQFLHLVLISPHVQQTVMDVQVGVSREGLSIGKLRQFVIPFPPLAEQRRIVARVKQLRRVCADLRERLQQARATQSRLADALVSAAAQSPSC